MQELLVWIIGIIVAGGVSLYAYFEFFINSSENISTSNSSGNGGSKSENPDPPLK